MINLTEALPKDLVKADFTLSGENHSYRLYHNHQGNTLVKTFHDNETSVLQIIKAAEHHLYLCKPEIRAFARGKEIGRSSCDCFILHACVVCGKTRWVQVRKGRPRNLRCRCCSHRKEGIHKDVEGYIHILLPKSSPFYPMIDSCGYVSAHRLAMAKHLGRCLHAWEWVRIKNHDRADVRIENLQLKVVKSYTKVDLERRSDDWKLP